MRRRIASLLIALAVFTPASLTLGALPAAAHTCGTPSAGIQQTGNTTLVHSGSMYCSGSDVTTEQIRVHAQICTYEFFGCRTWADVQAWPVKSKSGPGSLTDSHTRTNVATQHLYKTEVEAWAYYSGGGNDYWKVYSGEIWLP